MFLYQSEIRGSTTFAVIVGFGLVPTIHTPVEEEEGRDGVRGSG